MKLKQLEEQDEDKNYSINKFMMEMNEMLEEHEKIQSIKLQEQEIKEKSNLNKGIGISLFTIYFKTLLSKNLCSSSILTAIYLLIILCSKLTILA